MLLLWEFWLLSPKLPKFAIRHRFPIPTLDLLRTESSLSETMGKDRIDGLLGRNSGGADKDVRAAGTLSCSYVFPLPAF